MYKILHIPSATYVEDVISRLNFKTELSAEIYLHKYKYIENRLHRNKSIVLWQDWRYGRLPVNSYEFEIVEVTDV